jgi:hypothetical protein
MEFETQLTIILSLIVLISAIGYIYICIELHNEDIACKNIGFDKRGQVINNVQTCKDYLGNLHYVEFYGNMHKQARQINIGDTRVLEVN